MKKQPGWQPQPGDEAGMILFMAAMSARTMYDITVPETSIILFVIGNRLPFATLYKQIHKMKLFSAFAHAHAIITS